MKPCNRPYSAIYKSRAFELHIMVSLAEKIVVEYGNLQKPELQKSQGQPCPGSHLRLLKYNALKYNAVNSWQQSAAHSNMLMRG